MSRGTTAGDQGNPGLLRGGLALSFSPGAILAPSGRDGTVFMGTPLRRQCLARHTLGSHHGA